MSTDPLASLVSGVSFTTLETDLVSVATSLLALYIIYVGIRWVVRMVRHA